VSTYLGTADRPERAKAIAGVAAVHVALAFVILTGLNVRTVRQAVERLTTVNIVEPPPPPPVQPPPKPAPKPEATKKPQGAAARKAEPTPVVAPQPKLPMPSPIPAARVAGTGSSAKSGAGVSGTGTGAGEAGNGPGGGGDFAGFTPARRVTRIPDREYGRLASTGIRSGSVGVTVRVNSDGSVSNCRVARSSGDRSIDALMCQLTVQYIRFDPAHDPDGRPVAQDVTFFPNWWRP
jgi:protein TonB